MLQIYNVHHASKRGPSENYDVNHYHDNRDGHGDVTLISSIQGGPERMQQLRSLISRTLSIKRICFFILLGRKFHFSNKMTPWPLNFGWGHLDTRVILTRRMSFSQIATFSTLAILGNSKNFFASRRPGESTVA